MLGRAPRGLRRKLLAEVAHRKDLDAIIEELVDDPIGLMEDLPYRGLVPFWDYPTLLGEVPEEFDPSNQRVQPFE